MDALAELKAAARKALEFTHEIGECTFTLLTPTRTQVRECLHRHGLQARDGDALLLALLQRHLLQQHLVGWTGVRHLHVLPDAGTAPLPWQPDAVPLLLDAQPDWADALGAALLASMAGRQQRLEADAGN